MSNILPLVFVMAVIVATFFIMIVTSPIPPSDESDDTGDRADLPPTQWRRQPGKPSHLPFRQSRVERVSGYSRRTQRC